MCTRNAAKMRLKGNQIGVITIRKKSKKKKKLIQDFEEFNGITIGFFFVRGQTFNWFIGQGKKAQPEPLLRSLYILNRTTLSSSA